MHVQELRSKIHIHARIRYAGMLCRVLCGITSGLYL